ncbi:hypothetical protein [Nocardia sp. NPDC050793]|uniref:hypothetical protein n=1 Tax=Nocardia sp. NPDC050793 TaxID=3155159 RepID=UPI0033EA3C42
MCTKAGAIHVTFSKPIDAMGGRPTVVAEPPSEPEEFGTTSTGSGELSPSAVYSGNFGEERHRPASSRWSDPEPIPGAAPGRGDEPRTERRDDQLDHVADDATVESGPKRIFSSATLAMIRRVRAALPVDWRGWDELMTTVRPPETSLARESYLTEEFIAYQERRLAALHAEPDFARYKAAERADLGVTHRDLKAGVYELEEELKRKQEQSLTFPRVADSVERVRRKLEAARGELEGFEKYLRVRDRLSGALASLDELHRDPPADRDWQQMAPELRKPNYRFDDKGNRLPPPELEACLDVVLRTGAAILNDIHQAFNSDATVLRRRNELQATLQFTESYYEAARLLARAEREVILRALAEVRPFGGYEQGAEAAAAVHEGVAEGTQSTKEDLRAAEQLFPTDWVRAAAARGLLVLNNTKSGPEAAISGRAHFVAGGAGRRDLIVAVLGSDSPYYWAFDSWSREIMAHELGHRMELVIPGLMALQYALVRRRATDENGNLEDRIELYPDKDPKDVFGRASHHRFGDDQLDGFVLAAMLLLLPPHREPGLPFGNERGLPDAQPADTETTRETESVPAAAAPSDDRSTETAPTPWRAVGSPDDDARHSRYTQQPATTGGRSTASAYPRPEQPARLGADAVANTRQQNTESAAPEQPKTPNQLRFTPEQTAALAEVLTERDQEVSLVTDQVRDLENSLVPLLDDSAGASLVSPQTGTPREHLDANVQLGELRPERPGRHAESSSAEPEAGPAGKPAIGGTPSIRSGPATDEGDVRPPPGPSSSIDKYLEGLAQRLADQEASSQYPAPNGESDEEWQACDREIQNTTTASRPGDFPISTGDFPAHHESVGRSVVAPLVPEDATAADGNGGDDFADDSTIEPEPEPIIRSETRKTIDDVRDTLPVGWGEWDALMPAKTVRPPETSLDRLTS